ncbi:MAG: hydrolase TatD [Candidatus Pelagibacter sp. TMED64]|nr:hydrolase TatD [Candidatus Pelagibacter sp.]OUU66843.1 MAG: hydrolase TatD [Candidatus Pelagibacter sp. TMED64]|tara:strand:- start:442 stop:1218 length:777 start_codon:yes stop_codon:yes gene_type:complete
MIIDSHCHLDFPELYNDLHNVISRADLAEVKYLLTISTKVETFEKIKLIISKYKNIFGTFGIHPHEAKNHKDINSKKIVSFIGKNKKIIGIGETGLDFYYNHSDHNIQKKLFIEHINASITTGLPLIVHSRNAEDDTYELLHKYTKNNNLKVLMHCFTGSLDLLKKLLSLNCYISISGIITFKNNNHLEEVVLNIPHEKLLIETDSPYLSPEPLRGKKNEPSHIIHTLKKISAIKNINYDDLKKHTTQNFLKLFSINI